MAHALNAARGGFNFCYIRVCVCVGGEWGALMVDGGTHLNGSKNNKHLDLLFLKTLISISNLCHTKGL